MMLTTTAPSAPIDPAAARVTVPSRLSDQTLAALADRPPARAMVHSIWDELDELERTGQLPDVIATVRALLLEHQNLTRTGRCRGCRRGARRSGRLWRLWRRSPFPCELWYTVGLGLQGVFTRPGAPAQQPAAGRHAARSPR